MLNKTAKHSQFDFKGNPSFFRQVGIIYRNIPEQKITGNIHTEVRINEVIEKILIMNLVKRKKAISRELFKIEAPTKEKKKNES